MDFQLLLRCDMSFFRKMGDLEVKKLIIIGDGAIGKTCLLPSLLLRVDHLYVEKDCLIGVRSSDVFFYNSVWFVKSRGSSAFLNRNIFQKL